MQKATKKERKIKIEEFCPAPSGPVEKRRWRARTPRPVGISDAPCEREASWSAARQFRFGRQTAAFDQFEEFCLTPPSSPPASSLP
jgi:hypothetical protein